MREESVQPKLTITYPCEWPYVVIGASETDLRGAINTIMQNRTYTIAVSNTSTNGKYISLKVLVVVRNDEERIGIYDALTDHPATKIVI